MERAILELFRSHNGNATWQQLLDAGLTPAKIKHGAATGELTRMFPRVYAYGDPELIPLCREAAALLSLGSGAVLSHASAAAVWELTPAMPGPIHVTMVRRPRRRPGIRVHRVYHLDPRDVGIRSNLAVTSLSRTVIDFAAESSTIEVERVMAEAVAKERTTFERELRQALGRIPANHPGAAVITGLLERDGAALTRSEGERALRRLLRQAGLPQPVSNAKLYGVEPDLFWPEHALVVEFDGYPFHSSRASFERDRRRDQLLAAHGITVMRLTGRQLRDEPLAVIARIAQGLATRAA
jgi:very-short-patch-repair endonuclease